MANNYGNILSQSTNPLAFTTNGQNPQNSQPTVIKSNESSIRVQYDRDEPKSYLTYACNFTQSSTGTHTLDWTFTPNHNTKGYIKNDGFKIFPAGWMKDKPGSTFGELVEGLGLSASKPMPAEGGVVALDYSGLTYKESVDNRTNRLVDTKVFYKFPSAPLLDEDGTGDKEIFINPYIGQTCTNTPNPTISFRASTDVTYLHTYHGGLHTKDYGEKALVFRVDQYDDGTPWLNNSHLLYAYIDSNLGIVKKGTCSGLFTASVSPSSANNTEGSTTNIKCVSTNLNISKADKSQAKTNPRNATIRYTLGPTNNYYDAYYYLPDNDAYRYASWQDKEFLMTVYQDGGNLTIPDPTIEITFEYNTVDDKANAENWGTMGPGALTSGDHGYSALNYQWKTNEGTPAWIGGDVTTTPSRLTQEDTEVTEENNGTHYIIKCPDNTGTDIEIEIDGHAFRQPINTRTRSIRGRFLIECVNDDKGSAGSLSNELIYSPITPRREVPFTITQAGKINPNPSFTIKQKLFHYTSNEDTSIYPSLTFNGVTVTGQHEQTWTINSEGKKTLTIHVPSTRPSVIGVTGAQVKKRTSVLEGNTTLGKISSSGGSVKIPIIWNYILDDFQKGYIPNSGDYQWVTYFPDINAATGVEDDLGNVTSTFDIYQPGNGRIEQGAYPTVTITMMGVFGANGTAPWGSCTVTGSTSTVATITRNDQLVLPSADSFTFTAKSNNASISSISGRYSNNILTITHNGVSTPDREGYVNFMKSHGKLKYPNQTETIDDTLGLYYKVLGESYGGKIQISTTKVSGSGGSISRKADIDLTGVPTSGKSYIIWDLVSRNNDSGYIDGSTFKVPSTVNVGASDTTYDVVCSTVTAVPGTTSTWNVYGTIVGTVSSSLNNTPLHGTGFNNSSTGLICQLSTSSVTPGYDYHNYKFWWTPAIDGVTMTSSGRIATISGFTANIGGNNAIAAKTEYFGSGYWAKITGGQSASTTARKLGTLSAGWNTTTATSSVDVWQDGSGEGTTTNANTFIFYFYNCSGGEVSSSTSGSSFSASLSSSGPNDPQSVNGKITNVKWDSWSNNTNELSLTLNNVNYTGSGASIGAFDSNINTNIGVTVSSTNLNYKYKVICDGHEKTGSQSESVSVSYEVTWSDGVTTGLTRNISLSASNPGTWTYTCTKIVAKYTFTNTYNSQSTTITKEQSLSKSWTFSVDSKHYYNS